MSAWSMNKSPNVFPEPLAFQPKRFATPPLGIIHTASLKARNEQVGETDSRNDGQYAHILRGPTRLRRPEVSLRSAIFGFITLQ